jgi:diacylglycerol kinase (ATP)
MNNPEHPVSEFKSTSGFKRIVTAFAYSLAGFKAAWRYEHAFRQELILMIVATIVALILPVSAFEKLLLIGVFVLTLIIELLNSAIEAVVDRISLERHSLSKNAKDFGSAAVFLSLALAAATWLVILWPLILKALS